MSHNFNCNSMHNFILAINLHLVSYMETLQRNFFIWLIDCYWSRVCVWLLVLITGVSCAKHFFLSRACELIMQSYLPGRSPDSTRDQVDSCDFSCTVINFMLGMKPVTCNKICEERVLRCVISLLWFLYSNIHDILLSFLYIFQMW